MSTTNSDQKEPFPNVDPDSPVHILTYGNSKKHELDFAKGSGRIRSRRGRRLGAALRPAHGLRRAARRLFRDP